MPTPTGTDVRILHVEDDRDLASLTATCLEREDERFQVATAASVGEALEHLEDHPVDCIVSDYNMPGRNGIEFLETVRSRDGELPFILFTGRGSEEVASDAISAGVTDYLQKGSGTSQYAVLANRIGNAVEQYRSQRQLEASRERLSLLIDESPIGVVEWNEDFEFVQLNSAAESILGYDETDLIGESWREIIPPSQRDEMADRLDTMLENAAGTHSINQNVRADGERITCEWHNEVVTDERGRVVAIFSQFQDVTDREARERAVARLHDTARELMHAEVPTAVAKTVVEAVRDILDIPINSVHLYDDAEHRLEPVAWTAEAEEFIGTLPVFEPGDGLAWDVYETGTFELYEDVSAVEERFNPETSIRSEMILPLGDHGILLTGAPTAGKFDESDVSLVKTLTATATSAFDRIDRTAALSLERHRLRTLFETVPEPITRVHYEDGTPVLKDANPAFEETFGHSVEDAVGRSINDLIVPPDRRAEADTIDDRVADQGSVQQEVRRKTVDGLGDFLFRSVPVSGTDEHEEYFGIYIDVSELKHYERRLEEQNERLNTFAGVVSHDLRSPLNVAHMGVELAKERQAGDGADSADDTLEMTTRALDRMNDLIDDLLTLARHGERATELSPVSLADLCRECWETTQTDGATLEVETTRELRADRSQLRQVLENFVRNAVEHGGPDVTVTVGDLENGFYVEDDGDGIPPDEREKVFERGYSTAQEGTGYGLVIIEQVADAHGWDVSLTEASSGGTRFEVTGVGPGDE